MSSDTKSPRMKFGEPPTPRGPAYDWAYIAKRLKRRPGEWALVFEKDRVSLVNAIKAEVAERLVKGGAPPKVLAAACMVGAERSSELFEGAYDEHSRRMAKLYENLGTNS